MKTLFETLRADNGNRYATVRGKNEHGEYVVRQYNKRMTAIDNASQLHSQRFIVAEYFTNDLEDACHTAMHMVHGAERKTAEQFLYLGRWPSSAD